MIKALAHTCYTVRDLDASIDFYSKKLGLPVAFDFVNDQGSRYGVYLHAGGRSFIELFIGEPGKPSPNQSYGHCCFEVDDINATVAELRECGVEAEDPRFECDKSWQSWISDPDGNRIELHQYTPQSLQAEALKRLS